MGVGHALVALYRGCEFPSALLWAVAVYGITIFILFVNFYFQAYVKPVVLDVDGQEASCQNSAEDNGYSSSSPFYSGSKLHRRRNGVKGTSAKFSQTSL